MRFHHSRPANDRNRLIWSWLGRSPWAMRALLVLTMASIEAGLTQDGVADQGQGAKADASNSQTKPPAKADQPSLPKAGLAKAVAGTVVLTTTEPSSLDKLQGKRCCSLGREVARQAVLIAARDELMLGTLDQSLGEVDLVEKSPVAYPFDLDFVMANDPKDDKRRVVTVKLSRPDPSGEWFKWTSTPGSIAFDVGMNQLVPIMEEWSRGEFVTAFKEAGYESSLDAGGATVAVPDEFFDNMDFISQYAVLRHAHAERRAKGESRENLGSLVKAYANLGSLIDFHWSPMSKAFKARSLIYAQRMVAKYGEAADTLAYRAYAWALAGRHDFALADLKSARALPQDSVPAWLSLIHAFCEFKPSKLTSDDDAYDEFALYLLMRMLHPDYEMSTAIPIIQEMIQKNPVCVRAIDRMRETGSVGQIRLAAEVYSKRVWEPIYGRLLEFPSLPKAVTTAVKNSKGPALPFLGRNEHQSRLKVIAELRQAAAKADDRVEPSWTALSEMLHDLTFMFAQREVTSMAETLGFPPADVTPTVKAVMPLVEKHRFGKYLWIYTDEKEKAKAGIDEIFNSIRSTDIEIQAVALANKSYEVNPEYYNKLWMRIDRHWDSIYDDLLFAASSHSQTWSNEAWDRLITVSPHSTMSVARLIHKSPNFSLEQAKEWEEQYSDNGYLLLELGRKLYRTGRYTESVRCLMKSLEVAPTYDTATDLANVYDYLEDYDAAQKVLEDVQSLPSFGLESAHSHAQLAYLLMYQGKWDEALPHAETASQAYSAYGLNTMARCAEGLKDWETAEKYYRACSERYESYSGDGWYLFCVRRGRGDIESAKQLADRQLKSITAPNGVDQMWVVAIRAILDDQKQKAIDTFIDPKNKHVHDNFHFLLAAGLADQMGDTVQRDRLFGEIETKFASDALTMQLVNMLRRLVADPANPNWSHSAFLEIADDLNADNVSAFYFTAAEFLANHGQEERSKDYLRVAATSFDVLRRSCVLASQRLRSKGIEIPESRLNRQPDERIPFLKLLWKSNRLRHEARYAEARTTLDEAIALRPDFTRAILWRVRLNEFEHRTPDAIADLESVLKYNSESIVALQGLARWYSGSPDDSLRNGPKAAEYAQKAFDLRVTKRGLDYWCLAIAQAENGNFEKAVEYQEQAIKLEPKRQAWADQLALFKSSKPFRLTIPETPTGGVETTGEVFE